MLSFMAFTADQLELFLLDTAIKAAVVLAIACFVSLALSRTRSSAATRHLVWSLALIGVLTLPVLTLLLPSWGIATDWPALAALRPKSGHADTMNPTYVGVPLAWIPTTAEEPISEDKSSDSNSTAVALPLATRDVAAVPAMPIDSPSATSVNWMLVVWLSGVGLALLPMCLGFASLWILARRSQPVTNGPMVRVFRETADQLGLKRSVRFVQHAERPMPMTWGIWRATVLVPADAADWTPERLRVVLLHELSHVLRRDCLTQIIAQLARAVYWFNPLTWLAERQLRLEQEKACDDMVLRHGLKPSVYAQCLLEVLAGFRLPAGLSVSAMAMARRSKFEKRLRAILNSSQNRLPPTRRWRSITSALSLGMLIAVAVVHLESSTTFAEQQRATAAAGIDGSCAEDQAADQAKPLADLRAKISSQYVTPVNETEMVQGAIKGMIGALRDPYSDYLTPEKVAELEKQIGGTLVGIGVQLDLLEKQIRVVTALPESPALKAGILPGDLIVQIDDQPAEGMELPDVVKRITGANGTVVKLKIRRDGGQVVDISVTRSPITLQTVKGFRAGSDHKWEFMLDARRKIGYLQIAQFGPGTAKDLRAAVESLTKQELKGLILDLRFCPGGMLDASVDSSKIFLANGTIVTLHSRHGDPVKISADATNVAGDFPMIVLVNGQTASAAEVFAGALQDNHRAVVLGTRTIGKASVQSLIKLEDGGGAIKLTTSHYRLPGGRNIDRVAGGDSWGINPDEGFFVPTDRAQIKTLHQRRLQREVLGGKPADKSATDADVSASVVPASAKSIEEQHADPQLAAAHQAMVGRIDSGTFAKVANLTATEVAQFLKREDVEQRREAAVQNLEQIDRELANLKKDGGK